MPFSSQKKNGKTESGRRGLNSKKLILPLALEDGRVPGILQNMAFVTAALIAAGVFWANSAQIRELAVGQGEVVPTGAIKNVHHLEGGIIELILGEEGQIVEAGAPLIRLRPNAAESDLEQLSVRAAILNMQKKRLLALLRGHRFMTTSAMKQHPRLARDQLDLYNAQVSLRQQEERTLQARINQRMADFTALGQEIESAERQMALTLDRVVALKKLKSKKLVARKSLQEAMSDHEENVALHISAIGRRNAAGTAIEEARSLQLEARVKSQKAFTEELAKVSAELAQLEQAIAKQGDLVDRLYVRSPSRGVIQHMPFHSKGEVIKAGELVAKIIPVDENIVAEVRLDPRDIGHVSIGDPAEIKISTFDPNIFGVVQGKVNKLSASTFQSDKGEVYYKATIEMASNTVNGAGATHRITPGMVVQADIVTGEKSLVQYMLKPVYSSLDTAFTER